MLHNFFYLEIRSVYDVMSKSMAQPKGRQMTSQYDAYELNAG